VPLTCTPGLRSSAIVAAWQVQTHRANGSIETVPYNINVFYAGYAKGKPQPV
jgi:hypothetical protein